MYVWYITHWLFFKFKFSLYVYTCLHSECLENICRRKKKKNPVSCIVATFRPFPGKERGQETKKHTGLAWEKKKTAALVGEERESRMQLPWYFIHQLIYGLHTELNNPLLFPASMGPGERQSSMTPEAESRETQRSVCGGNLQNQYIDPLIVLWELEGVLCSTRRSGLCGIHISPQIHTFKFTFTHLAVLHLLNKANCKCTVSKKQEILEDREGCSCFHCIWELVPPSGSHQPDSLDC